MTTDSKSNKLSIPDREKLAGWDDIDKPEPDQILPLHITQELEPTEPDTNERLLSTRDLASKILAKIDDINQKIDNKCSKFKVSSPDGIGSPLFQAMVRVFNERTTTVTYDHYKRALHYRQQLAREDAERLKLE